MGIVHDSIRKKPSTRGTYGGRNSIINRQLPRITRFSSLFYAIAHTDATHAGTDDLETTTPLLVRRITKFGHPLNVANARCRDTVAQVMCAEENGSGQRCRRGEMFCQEGHDPVQGHGSRGRL